MSTKKTIVIAGMGRCGSTLLFKSVGGSWEKSIREIFVRDLREEDIQPGRILKTHDFAPEFLPPYVKVVYLFGDPFEIVLSSWDKMKQKDITQHVIHMHGAVERQEHMFSEDVFRLEENFHSWHREHSYPVLTVRYETMWQNLDSIRDFIGKPVSLPSYKKRWNYLEGMTKSELTSLRKTYGRLKDKVTTAPDVTIW